MVGCGHRVVLLRLTWRSFEGSRDDRPPTGYDTPPTSGNPYTTSLDATKTATLTLDRYGHLFPDDLGRVAFDTAAQTAADALRTIPALRAVASD